MKTSPSPKKYLLDSRAENTKFYVIFEMDTTKAIETTNF